MNFGLAVDLYERILSEIKNNDNFLLGILEINDSEYKQIQDIVRFVVNRQFRGNDNIYSGILCFGLVQFAIRDYKLGSFWEEASEFFKVDQKQLESKAKSALEHFLQKHNLYFHYGNVNRGYVVTILVHAILPNENLGRFFNLLFELYFRDLEEDYDEEEVDSFLNYLIRLFEKYLDEEEISIEIQGHKYTLVQQELPKAFRIALVKSPNIIKPILKPLFYIIHCLHYNINENNENEGKNRFERSLKKHSFQLLVNQQRKSSNTLNTIKSNYVQKFKRANYLLKGNNLVLRIPRQIIETEYINDNLFVVVSDGFKEYSEELILTKNKLFFKTEQIEITLENFSNTINYKIFSGKKIIYDSEDKLYRDYILFDSEGVETKISDFSSYEFVRILSFRDTKITTTDDVEIEYHNNYKIVYLLLEDNTLITIEDTILSHKHESLNTGIDKSTLYSRISINDGHTRYKIYRDFPIIYLRINKEKSINDFLMEVNNQKFSLNEIVTFTSVPITDGTMDIFLRIQMSDVYFDILQPIHIKIREKGNITNIIEEKLFIIPDLEYKFNKNLYFEEAYGELISLNSSYINFNIEIPYKFSPKKINSLNFPLTINSQNFTFEIEIPKLLINFNPNQIAPICKNVWWKDINSKYLYIKSPYDISSIVVTSEHFTHTIHGKKVNGFYRFDIERYIHVKLENFITIKTVFQNSEFELVHIHYEDFVTNCCISYNNYSSLLNGLSIFWDHIGESSLSIDLIEKSSSNIIKTYNNIQSNWIIDKDISLKYGEYEVHFYSIEFNEFLGLMEEKKSICKFHFVVGDILIVKTKSKIVTVYEAISGKESFPVNNFYLEKIKFGEKEDTYLATGFYLRTDYITGNKIKWFFTKHNPFQIRLIDYKNDVFIFEMVDKDRDGLVLDSYKGYINPSSETKDLNRYKLIEYVKARIIP